MAGGQVLFCEPQQWARMEFSKWPKKRNKWKFRHRYDVAERAQWVRLPRHCGNKEFNPFVISAG